MRFSFLFLFFALLRSGFSLSQFEQNIFYQENCHCMVVADGQYGNNGPEIIYFNTPLPSFLTQVKKVYLTGSIGRLQAGFTNDSLLLGYKIKFNDITIPITRSDFSSESIRILAANPMDPNLVFFGKYFNLDVTAFFNTSSPTQSLLPPPTNSNLLSEIPIVEHFFLNVIYEDPALPLTNIVLVSKKRHVAPIDKFILTGKINPINTTKKIALCVNASDICNDSPDTSYVFVNGQRCGELSKPEDATVCSGVSGNFAFFSDSLIAYDNDTADSLFKDADGVANIQPYLTNSLDLDIQFQFWNYYSSPGSSLYTNPIHQIAVAYTTTCEEFTVSTPEPQAVCKNEPLQLSVTGGSKYEWLPQRGLSCYDCPNPLVSTDSSRFYTVRVWNNDSCSVVRPVHVTVNELPRFNTADITPTQCADSTGKIAISKHASVGAAVTWSLNGGAFETGGATVKNYENLPEGSYTITLKDNNGCTRDTTVELGYTVNTTANFTLNPEKGVAPLTVNVTNQSTNYTNSAWYLQNNFTDSSLTQFTLDQSGTYTLQLITWYKDPKCADTAERTILVYDTLVVAVPNVFSPNNDGVNDFFGIQSNQPAEVSYQLLNRWGNVVHEGKTNTTGEVFLPLWDGNGFEEGVYFYLISIEAKDLPKQEVKGFFHLER